MVLYRCFDPKLLAVSSVRSELEISLVELNRCSMDDCSPRRLLLHSSLGTNTLGPGSSFQRALVAASHLCYRSRRSTLVPNALGNFWHWPVHAVGWMPAGWCAPGSLVVVVAWTA